MKYKSGRGGAREGAGRPKGIHTRIADPATRRTTIGIRLPAYMVDWLKNQDQAAGRIIEAALLKIHKHALETKRRNFYKFSKP